ncbi:glycosyltransferase [Salinibius halmophilus]|uniref:glycosyltransferase n=1 Tax=Salinibius halmophilus TaxID=1853216 RepID=UPI000E6604F5|nr:glycosyltransferase [Salinibius halmophilus]
MSSLSVIISSYNNSPAMVKTLAGYSVQTNTNFDIIIADDGSSQAHLDAIEAAIAKFGLTAQVSTIADKGFRKCKALNDAVRLSTANALLFTDADIVPRKDLVAQHKRLLKPGFFIAGGSHIHTTEASLPLLTESSILSNDCFTKRFWHNAGHSNRKIKQRFERGNVSAALLNLLSWRSKAFIGCNASCWRESFEQVNGFDESIGYGAEDIDFGLRLTNAGVKSRRYTYSLIGLHQWHPRPYRNESQVQANKAHIYARYRQGVSWIDQ